FQNCSYCGGSTCAMVYRKGTIVEHGLHLLRNPKLQTGPDLAAYPSERSWMASCRLAGLRSRVAEEQGRPESVMGWEPSERRDRQDQELSEGERRQGRERKALPMGERAMVRRRP